MHFEWDLEKAAANLRKHGVSSAEAATLFGDPLSRTFPDPAHSLDEQRFLTVGMSEGRRLLVVAHTEHGRYSNHQRQTGNSPRAEMV